GVECTAHFFLPARIPVKLTKVGCRLRTRVPWAGRVFTPAMFDRRPITAWAVSGLDRGRPAFGTDREASVKYRRVNATAWDCTRHKIGIRFRPLSVPIGRLTRRPCLSTLGPATPVNCCSPLAGGVPLGMLRSISAGLFQRAYPSNTGVHLAEGQFQQSRAYPV